MVFVTGGVGFIGNNIVKCLEQEADYDSVVVLDCLKDGTGFKNLVDCKFIDYFERDDFINLNQLRPFFMRVPVQISLNAPVYLMWEAVKVRLLTKCPMP